MAGHGRGFIVQDDQGKAVIVVDGIDQTGDARCEKRWNRR